MIPSSFQQKSTNAAIPYLLTCWNPLLEFVLFLTPPSELFIFPFPQLSEGVANMNTDLQDLAGYFPQRSRTLFPEIILIWNIEIRVNVSVW